MNDPTPELPLPENQSIEIAGKGKREKAGLIRYERIGGQILKIIRYFFPKADPFKTSLVKRIRTTSSHKDLESLGKELANRQGEFQPRYVRKCMKASARRWMEVIRKEDLEFRMVDEADGSLIASLKSLEDALQRAYGLNHPSSS